MNNLSKFIPLNDMCTGYDGDVPAKYGWVVVSILNTTKHYSNIISGDDILKCDLSQWINENITGKYTCWPYYEKGNGISFAFENMEDAIGFRLACEEFVICENYDIKFL